MLRAGDDIDVYVLKVDRERARIGLSRKRVPPNPQYDVIENRLEGSLLSGTASRVVSYGGFGEIGEAVEGLVHVSDMPHGQATGSSLELGSDVTLRLLEIDE